MVETPIEGAIGRAMLGVETLEVWGLEAGFEGVEGIDKEVDCEGCECSGLKGRLAMRNEERGGELTMTISRLVLLDMPENGSRD